MRFHVHRHHTVASTSETAFEALRAGTARHGDVHVARAQTAGRGRQGRAWHSAEGEGLYLSLVWLPERALSPAGLTIAAGLAVRDAVSALGLAAAWLKWPNDVVVPSGVGDAKLAGILVETRGLDPARPHYVIGIGVNVAQRAFPPELVAERPVASLATAGIVTDVETVLERLLPALGARLEEITAAPRRLAGDYLAATGLAGRPVVLHAGGEALAGRIERIDLAHGLALALEGGATREIPLEVVRELRAC